MSEVTVMLCPIWSGNVLSSRVTRSSSPVWSHSIVLSGPQWHYYLSCLVGRHGREGGWRVGGEAGVGLLVGGVATARVAADGLVGRG